MTRWTILALFLVFVALFAVVAGVLILARHDRAALVERFATERLEQVDKITREFEDDFNDIGEDLRFASQLLMSTSSQKERKRELGALLAVVRQYRRFEIFDEEGKRILLVADPLATPGQDPDIFTGTMQKTAAQARTRPPGEMVTSPPIAPDKHGWHRVFAASLPPPLGGAIAVLVDTEVFFRKLHIVALEPTSRLILLGAHGRPSPATDPLLSDVILRLEEERVRLPRFASLIDRMHAGARGTLHLNEEEASMLGLGGAEVVAAYAPIHMRGLHWSAAILTSTEELRSHEWAIALRLGIASGVIALSLIAFGAYLIVASRRAAAFQEQLKHAERLAHLHEKTEKILDHIPTGVMALSEEGLVTAINQALREKIPQAVGEKLTDAFPHASPEVVGHLGALFERALASEKVQSLFGERLSLFGEQGQYNLHAVPLGRLSPDPEALEEATPKPRFAEVRALLVIEDLSKVRSLETQLLRAEKLATVGILAAGIAHEIGTPLSVVRGRAEYVLGKLGEDHPQAPGVQVIVEQIDRVTRTIRQLLDFTRAKPAFVRPVSLEQIAHAVVELLRFEAERRKVQLSVKLSPSLPPLAADPDQLQQALVNLLINACDAAPGGSVLLLCRPGEATPAAEPGVIRIEVIDNGCGIPPEHRHRIFDPFFTTKKRGQGTGLGLSIVAQIVQNHGGQIEIENEPGGGTRVVLLWPTAPTGTKSSAQTDHESTPQSARPHRG